MGVYHIVANLDKRQYLNPHELDSGAKIKEIAGGTVAVATTILLSAWAAELTTDGGNDLVGSWSGDRVAIFSDQDPEYDEVQDEYENISQRVRALTIEE